MLKFEQLFKYKNPQNVSSLRQRILGETLQGDLLLMVNTPNTTSIEVISADGKKITALQFKEYIDIVNADLSPDLDLIHICKRIPSPKGFAFSSVIYQISTLYSSKEFITNFPSDGLFLNEYNLKTQQYQMLHLVNGSLTHLLITARKKKLEIEKYRGGIPRLNNLFAYNLSKTPREILSLVFKNEEKFFFSDTEYVNEKPISVRPPSVINVIKESTLPPELALSPATRHHYPLFSCTNNRIFFAKYHSRTCVIQQLFFGLDSKLAFSVSTFPKGTYREITISQCESGYPISFAQLNALALVFIPNVFLCIIDIGEVPPSIITLPGEFVSGAPGLCCSSLPLINHIIDIDTGFIYKVSVDLPEFIKIPKTLSVSSLKSYNRSFWFIIAQIAARANDPLQLSAALSLLRARADIETAYQFTEDLFLLFGATDAGDLPFGTKNARNHCYPSSPRNSTFSIISVNPNPISHTNQPISHMQIISPRFSSTSQSKSHLKIHVSRHIREKLLQMENMFPSAGSLSRTEKFIIMTKEIKAKKETNSDEAAASKALAKMNQQNDTSLMIRNAINCWRKTLIFNKKPNASTTPNSNEKILDSKNEKPKENDNNSIENEEVGAFGSMSGNYGVVNDDIDDKLEGGDDKFWNFLFSFTFQSESYRTNFPQIDCLKDEVIKMAAELCPDAMEAQLGASKVFGYPLTNTQEEFDFWKDKVPMENSFGFSFEDSEASDLSCTDL